MKKINIISHTHWDREWYLNSKYTNEWLVFFFDGLFNMIEKEPEYQFVLDGQTMLLEDYFVELRKKGISVSDKKAKLQKYVASGNIFMGPLYNQPDWQLVSEESLVKNLVLGNQIANTYGKKMKIGWLLDNFGQISQTSQILKNAELDGIYVWRGVEMNPKNVNSEFLWESPDGTKLPSVYLLDSYRNGMRLAEYNQIFDIRMQDTIKRLTPFATTDNMLMLNGYDQEVEPDDVLSMIKDGKSDTDSYKVVQTNPEDYMKAIMKEEPDLQTLSGALYSGRFISVFPGILSARMYLKQQNHNSEKLVEKLVEPLSVMNWLTGGEYHDRHIDAAYKKMLMNQPHDSICGCSIDDVHKDMEERTNLVDTLYNDEIDAVLSDLLSKIDTSKGLQEKPLVVFNTSPYNRDFVLPVEGGLAVKNVPSMGYKVVEKVDKLDGAIKVNEDKLTIENNKVLVTLNPNGSIDLFDKEQDTLYQELGLLKDMADSGDEYNYSFPDVDKIFTTKDIEANVEFVTNSEQLVVVKVSYDFEIPRGINKTRTERVEETIKMPVTTYIKVTANSAVVEFETDILNTAKNHNVSVLFETGLKTDYSSAGAQFDVVKRAISYEDFDESEIPEHVREVIIGAREPKPNRIFPHREFVDLTDETKGLAVLNKGLPEFTVYEENNTIGLTLFRSVEWVADEINSRLGDAGPKIFTPDAQCLRQMKFQYAVYPHTGNYEAGAVIKEADSYNTAPIVVATEKSYGTLPNAFSFVEVNDTSNAVKVTGFKRSLDRQALTLRLYNGSNELQNFSLSSSLNIKNISITNFLEEKETEVKEELISINPKEIITLKLYIDSMSLHESIAQINRLDFDFREDYKEYPMADYVTDEEILAEIERAKSMEHLVETPDMGRTALEAQLSAILTRIRKDEQTIKDLGWKLNHARVIRRVWDYIKKYHQE